MPVPAAEPTANAPSLRPAPPWLLVLVCGSIVMALSVGVRQVSGLFLRPVALDLGLSREAFGAAVALQNLVWGLAQPLAGLLADRYGGRPVAVAGGVCYALGMALAASATNGPVFTLGLGVLGGIGQAGTAYAVILAVIGRAAPDGSRSLAIGLGSTAGSVGMFVLVPIASALIDLLAWRQAMLAVCGMLAAIPLLALALRERGAATTPGALVMSAGQIAGVAWRDRDFWLLNLGFASCGFQLAFIAVYTPALLADRGLDTSAGAAMLAAIGATNILSTWASGVAGGRWLKSRLLALIYVGRAAVMVAFLSVPLSAPGAVAFGIAFGLVWTGTVPLTSSLVADLWGRRNLGFLFALVYVGHQFGAFVGAWAGGYAFDRLGSFDPVWYAAILLSLTAAACHLVLVERPRPTALAESAA